ncbi:pro-resilin-like [Anoplophora glabripennis]|uniref:pro-resilin-like n=1 Tax=Anoplophora glabripennis TaxID=217634 RepID=UPI000874896C|nr:pro-resilin-like [Anoplophora glabripennis]
MKVAVVLLATISFALAEPPVPSSEYLPANQYIPPSNQYGAPKPFSLPSNSYGAPAQTQAVIRPNNLYGPPKPVYGAPNAAYLPPGGYGKGYDYEGEPANYQFEYHVEDPPSGNDFGHQEERQGDVAKGKYFVLLPDGRLQTVEYTADLDGYKPKISYQQVGGGYPSGGPGGYQY